MADYFLDSSALVKRYVDEVGSAWIVGLFDPASEHEVFMAMTLAETHALRGYDALQLAVAVEVNALSVQSGLSPMIFVAADDDLNAAARGEGMIVQNPAAHG